MNRKRSVRKRRYATPWTKKCKELCRQFIAFMFSNVGIIGLVVSYMTAGSFIFHKIEKEYIVVIKDEVNKTRTNFVEYLWNKTLEMNPFDECLYKNFTSTLLIEYQHEIVDFIRKGYDGPDENYAQKWSFSGAFLYSLTVITTIGYGNISPHTITGKIVTIVYAIIGMPLFLLYLSNIGDIMARSFKWIYANCCLCRWCPGVAKRRAEREMRMREMGSQYDSSVEDDEETQQQDSYRLEERRLSGQPNSITSEASQNVTEAFSEDSYDVQTVTVPITVCLTIMVGYICSGGLLFMAWEGWSFSDASYFCFISLSTIGFGDLVPGENILKDSKGEENVGQILNGTFIFCSMYLMLGMALIAMCFNLMQEEVINKIRASVRTVKYILRCTDDT